jgi:hypothetical protein
MLNQAPTHLWTVTQWTSWHKWPKAGLGLSLSLQHLHSVSPSSLSPCLLNLTSQERHLQSNKGDGFGFWQRALDTEYLSALVGSSPNLFILLLCKSLFYPSLSCGCWWGTKEHNDLRLYFLFLQGKKGSYFGNSVPADLQMGLEERCFYSFFFS